MIDLRGTPASSGLARGRRVRSLRIASHATAYCAGTPSEGRGRLETAIAEEKCQLGALVARLDNPAAEILIADQEAEVGVLERQGSNAACPGSE
jgi:hypothetical protein